MRGNAQNATDAAKADLSKDAGVAATCEGRLPTLTGHVSIDDGSSTLPHRDD